MALYPTLDKALWPHQHFRLTKIGELDAFLSKECDDRRRLAKKISISGLLTMLKVWISGFGWCPCRCRQRLEMKLSRVSCCLHQEQQRFYKNRFDLRGNKPQVYGQSGEAYLRYAGGHDKIELLTSSSPKLWFNQRYRMWNTRLLQTRSRVTKS